VIGKAVESKLPVVDKNSKKDAIVALDPANRSWTSECVAPQNALVMKARMYACRTMGCSEKKDGTIAGVGLGSSGSSPGSQ
jgi:hypothetical protein